MIDGYFQRGLAYGKIKNYDASIPDYSQGIKLAPTDAQFWHNSALVYVDKGLPDLDDGFTFRRNESERQPVAS